MPKRKKLPFPKAISENTREFIQKTFQEYDSIFVQPYAFVNKLSAPEEWEKLELRKIAYKDQKYRIIRTQIPETEISDAFKILEYHWTQNNENIDTANKQKLIEIMDIFSIQDLIKMGTTEEYSNPKNPHGRYFEFAWLIAQHSDEDIPFQQRFLAEIENFQKQGIMKTTPEFAYLKDRVLTNEGKPQIYGTQGNIYMETWHPYAIVDAHDINTRRAQIFTESEKDYRLAAYISFLRSTYNLPQNNGEYLFLKPVPFNKRKNEALPYPI